MTLAPHAVKVLGFSQWIPFDHRVKGLVEDKVATLAHMQLVGDETQHFPLSLAPLPRLV